MRPVTFERKNEIINQATELFKVKGYSATSMRDIAASVGIEAPSLYSHYQSKEEILQKICFGMAHKFLDNLEESQKAQELSPGKQLHEIIKKHVLLITNNLGQVAVFWNEWRYMSEPHFSDFVKMQRTYEKGLKEIIDRGIDSGEFNRVNSTFTTMAILSSLNGIQKWHNYTLSPEIMAENFAQLFIEGIKL